jgi:hypothetical protein
MNRERIRITNKIFIFAVLLTGLFGHSIFETNANGIVLEPAYIELNIEEGMSREIVFELKGDEATDTQIDFLTGEFDEEGRIGISDENTIGPWLERVEYEGANEYRFRITIPEDAPSGLYIPMIRFGIRDSSDEEAQLGINMNLIGSIYAKVKNHNDEGLYANVEISDFQIANSFSTITSNSFNFEYTNTGNIYTKAIGYFEIFDPQGYKLRTNYNINPEYANIHPDQSIRETFEWEDNFVSNKFFPSVGEYKVKLYIKSIESENYNMYENSFVVVPPIYLGYSTGILISLVLVVILVRRNYKSDKRVKVKAS